MSFTELWDLAQKGTPVAIVILAVGGAMLWRAYQLELAYSKSRDRETLTMLLSLSHLITNLDKDKHELREFHTSAKREVLDAIGRLEENVKEHFKK